MKKYNPFKIGKRLYKDGFGISDIGVNVRCDADIPEAYRGYCYQMHKQACKEIKILTGDSRVGLGNM